MSGFSPRARRMEWILIKQLETISSLYIPMLSGASVAAHRVFSPPVSNPQQDQRSRQPGTNPPHTENSVAGAGAGPAAKAPVQPVSETQKPNDTTGAKKADGEDLSEEEDRQVRELKQTDAKVRAHEQAHAVAGGPYASAPGYKFTTGPDGKRYATSGEVEIDNAPVRGDPEATIRKMDVVIRAALSPAEPSSQDLAVARTAQQQRAKAQGELFKQRAAGRGEKDGEAPADDGAPASTAQPDALLERIAEAAAAYARTADNDKMAQTGELLAAAQELSIVV